MMENIYIFGHTNPDTDSICSAIAYANLKQKLGYKNAIAYRLGKINKETSFVLDYFGIKQPDILADVKVKVSDLNLYPPIKLPGKSPVKHAWNFLSEKAETGSKIMPIEDDEGQICGIVSLEDVAKTFIDISNEEIVKQYEILFQNLVEVLNGKVFSGRYQYERIDGSIFIGTNLSDERVITDRDIVITEKLETALKYAYVYKCGCIILTDCVQPAGFESAETAIVSVPHTVFKTVGLINQAISLRSILVKKNLNFFLHDSYLDDIIDTLKTSPYRNFPVIDVDGQLTGIISRRHLIEYSRKKVILIDHNEKSQSVEGLDQAVIIELIDHHRIAEIQTDAPLYVRSEPVGCTATIVYKLYCEQGIDIEVPIAGILLSAILSDTLILSSPTTTPADHKAAAKLAEIAGVDVEEYGFKMFKVSTSLDEYNPEELLSLDRKVFRIDRHIVYISQVNTLELQHILDRKTLIIESLKNFSESTKNDLTILLITDTIANGTELFAVGKSKELLTHAYDMASEQTNIFLPGVVSRKTQVVPRLIAAANMF